MGKLIVLLFISVVCLGQWSGWETKSTYLKSEVKFIGDTTCEHLWVSSIKQYGVTYLTYPEIRTYSIGKICQKCLRHEIDFYEETESKVTTAYELLEEKAKRKKLGISDTAKGDWFGDEFYYKYPLTVDSLKFNDCFDTSFTLPYYVSIDTSYYNTKLDTTYYEYIFYTEGLGEFYKYSLKISPGWVVGKQTGFNYEILYAFLPNDEIIEKDKIFLFLSKGEYIAKFTYSTR